MKQSSSTYTFSNAHIILGSRFYKNHKLLVSVNCDGYTNTLHKQVHNDQLSKTCHFGVLLLFQKSRKAVPYQEYCHRRHLHHMRLLVRLYQHLPVRRSEF